MSEVTEETPQQQAQAPAVEGQSTGGAPRRDERPRRRGGGGGRFGRRRVCSFCVDKVQSIDYKEPGRLRRYISDLRAAGFNVVPQTVALYRKISFPFVTLIMTLIAVPFAVTTGRRGALYGIGVGIVLAVVYWMTINAFGAIGSAGLLAPMLAAWAPNLIFGAGAAYLLLTVRT